MNTLSESQTEHIRQWVKSHHLTIHSLENEFIDHICCDIEELMDDGNTFKHAFERMRMDLGEDILPGLEKQTILQLTYNQRIMKFMTRLTGIIVLLSFFAAIVSRFAGFDFWKTLMAGGMVVLSLGFAPLFFLDHFSQQELKSQKVLHIFGFLSAFLIPLSAFLVMFNSPHALKFMGAGILFLLLGFIPLSIISVSKGSARSVLTGSVLLLLFFVLMAFGLMQVRISKDRINSWVYISASAEQSASVVNKMNLNYVSEMSQDSAFTTIATEIVTHSDKMVQRISEFRNTFIMELDPSYQIGNAFFSGMDNHYTGKKLLIDNEETSLILIEMKKYEKWLLSVLSEQNELIKEKISSILKTDFTDEYPDLESQKNYLFRDFPAITDVSVINGMILTIRLAEFQALKFLDEKAHKNL